MKSQVTVLGRRSGQPRQHRSGLCSMWIFDYSPAEVIDIVQTALRAGNDLQRGQEPPPNCIMMDFKRAMPCYACVMLTDWRLMTQQTRLCVRALFSRCRRANIPLSIPAHVTLVTEEDRSRREKRARRSRQTHWGAEGGRTVSGAHGPMNEGPCNSLRVVHLSVTKPSPVRCGGTLALFDTRGDA